MRNCLKHIIIISCLVFNLKQSRAQETWSAVGGGYFGIPSGSTVQSLRVIDDTLFAGGGFSWTGTITAYGIAAWDGNNWISFGSGISYTNSVEKYNGVIYAGTNSATIPLARWNGNNWSGVGNKNPDGEVFTLKYKDKLYVGGDFYSLKDTDNAQIPITVKRIASWNGSYWNPVGGGVSGGGPPRVTAMTIYNDELYIGGTFNWAGAQEAFYIARWNGSQWNKVGDYGVMGSVDVFTTDTVNNILYAAGPFTFVDTLSAQYIGRWDGNKWSALSGDTMIGYNYAALAIYNGYLYAGGHGLISGNPPDTFLVRWDAKKWEHIGGPNCDVSALEVYQNELYVGGCFQYVNGDSSMRYLARFNTPNYCDSVNISFSVSEDTVYLSDSAMLQTAPSGFSNQYQWDFGDSTETDTAQFPTHYYTNDGFYTIKLKSTFGFCPWYSAMKTVVVVNDVGIEEQKNSESKLKIYPNPADGSFMVEIHNSSFAIQNSSLKIYDARGKLLKELKVGSRKIEVKTNDWAKGIYFVNLISDGKVIAKEKIVIK